MQISVLIQLSTSMENAILQSCRLYQILDGIDDSGLLQRAYIIVQLLNDCANMVERLLEKTIYFLINYLHLEQLDKQGFNIKLITYFILVEQIKSFIIHNPNFIQEHIDYLTSTKEFLYFYKQDIKELDELDGIMYVHMFLTENEMKYSIQNVNIKDIEQAQYIFSQLFTIRRYNQYFSIYVDNYKHCKIQVLFQYNQMPFLENGSEISLQQDELLFLITNARCFDIDFEQMKLTHVSIANLVPEKIHLANYSSLKSITLHSVRYFFLDEEFNGIKFPNLIHLSFKQVSGFDFNSLNGLGFERIEYIHIQQCQIHEQISVEQQMKTLKILKIQSNERYNITFNVCLKDVQILSLEKGIVHNLYFRPMKQLHQFVTYIKDNITPYTLSLKRERYFSLPQHMTYEQYKLDFPMFDDPNIDPSLQSQMLQGLILSIRLLQVEYYQTILTIPKTWRQINDFNYFMNVVINIM